jgi:hypothetical protein
MEELEKLERRVPIVSDKAIISLVNGIQINYELIRYQRQQGFFGRLFDGLSGADAGRRILLDGNLIAGQQALCDWVMEFADSLRISQIAFEVTQNSLIEARSAIRKQKQSLMIQSQEIEILDGKLSALTNKIDSRIDEIEDRVHTLELAVAAQKDFEQVITAWEAKLSYIGLPWIIQVVMLVKEIFSSSVTEYELKTQDTLTYRNQLANRILATSELAHTKFFSLSDLLDSSWQQIKNIDDFQLSLGILETHTLPYSRRQRIPLMFTLSTTLELAALAEEIRPSRPGRCAVEICRAQIQGIDYTTTMNDVVTKMIAESANDTLLLVASNART